MRHYEYIDGESSRFWEIDLRETVVVVRYGRMGTSGRSRRWQFGSRDEAKRDWEKRIENKTKRGYHLVSVAESEGARESRATLATNTDLEAAILANPDDDEAILVYGDWLAERADPRGQLILTYARMHGETDPSRFMPLKKHCETIVAENRGAFFGQLVEYLDRVRIRWRLGFFDDVRIFDRGDEPTPHETLNALLAAPATLLLRVLRVDGFDLRAQSRLLAAELPSLQSLALEVAADGHALAELETLAPLFDLKVAPRLKRLTIEEAPDGNALIRALVRSPLAMQLTHLGIAHTRIFMKYAKTLCERMPALESIDFPVCDLDDDFIDGLRAQLALRSAAARG